jgi:hypothetical protein
LAYSKKEKQNNNEHAAATALEMRATTGEDLDGGGETVDTGVNF